jgi:hypothetical protein
MEAASSTISLISEAVGFWVDCSINRFCALLMTVVVGLLYSLMFHASLV